MPAHAFLAVVRADEHAHRPTPDDVIPFVLQRDLPLFIALVVRPARDTAHPLAWSDWRGRPPGTITHQSLPEANRILHIKITNYGWSGQSMAAALMSNGWGFCASRTTRRFETRCFGSTRSGGRSVAGRLWTGRHEVAEGNLPQVL